MMKGKKYLLVIALFIVTAAVITLANRRERSLPAPTVSSVSPPSEALTIAIVTSPSDVDDGNFNQEVYDGILDFIADHPDWGLKKFREMDITNSVPVVKTLFREADVFVLPGFQFAAIYDVAVENADKKIILVDTSPVNSDGVESHADNIYGMLFSEQEAGFLAGIAAAIHTRSGKVAVVNGMAFPDNVNYQFGFESGVVFANKKLGASANVVELELYAGMATDGVYVGGNYVGSFNDPATAKKIADELLSEGADIIFAAAGNSGNGVFEAVKEHGSAFVIGVDVDQYDLGWNDGSNIVLTSAVKKIRREVTRQLCAIADGSFKGGNYVLGADSDSTGYVNAEGRHQLNPAALAALEKVYGDIKSGKIIPASNFNGYSPEKFPGLE
jgi:basic membrane protein A